MALVVKPTFHYLSIIMQKIKKEESHPLCVFNSQKGISSWRYYGCEYVHYCVRCVHYGEPL